MQDTNAKLIKACLRGDRSSQRKLYAMHEQEMFRVCLRYGNTREAAEDMLQEGFIRIFKDLHQYSGDGPLGGWMYKVMVRSALQYLRKEKRTLRHFEQLDTIHEVGKSPEVFDALNAEALTREIQALPEGYRIVFNLYVIDGYKHEEIAKELGISVNTSKSQLSRAKAKLRESLEHFILTKA